MENERWEFRDDFIESMLENAKRRSLDEDFEKQLIKTIHNTLSYKKEVLSGLRKSMLYFAIGMAFIVSCALMLIFRDTLFKSTINPWPILALFITIAGIMVVMNNYKRLFKLMDTLGGEGFNAEFSGQ